MQTMKFWAEQSSNNEAIILTCYKCSFLMVKSNWLNNNLLLDKIIKVHQLTADSNASLKFGIGHGKDGCKNDDNLHFVWKEKTLLT